MIIRYEITIFIMNAWVVNYDINNQTFAFITPLLEIQKPGIKITLRRHKVIGTLI
jgi:hypothetical protein